MFYFDNLLESLTRKKKLQNDLMETPLKRCLNLFDLVMLGASNMIGAGIFVVIGAATRNIAGPGIIISFFLAGFAAFLSSLSYAEFGARIPKAGSIYTFTYLTMGEFPAFIIGWNMLLEMVIGAASVSKTWSVSLDRILNGTISNGIITHVGEFSSSWMSPYPDFVAGACIIVWMTLITIGAKLSSVLNNILISILIFVILLFIGFGIYFGNFSNWTNKANGGFLPFGISGVLAASASCFFSFSGFDVITTASEETKNPTKNIPIAIILSVTFTILLYVAAAAALTLMVPFFEVDLTAPFILAIQSHGCIWGGYVVGIGALFGLSAAVLGSLWTISRIAYAMAFDGLLFKALAYVNAVTQTPIVSCVICTLFTSIVAFLIKLDALVELLSIGSLLSYTVISINVLIIRYQTVDNWQFQLKPDTASISITDDSKNTDKLILKYQHLEDIGRVKKQFVKFPGINKIPDGSIAPITLSLMVVFSSAIFMVITNFNEDIMKWWVILLLTVLSLCFLVSYFLLSTHQQNTSFLTFQVPLVPFLPVLSMVINIGLMLNLNLFTWIRLAVWIVIGSVIYFGYGIRHSNEREKLLSKTSSISYYGEPSVPAKESTITLSQQSD